MMGDMLRGDFFGPARAADSSLLRNVVSEEDFKLLGFALKGELPFYLQQ